MYLKSIEIHGFKSFANKIKFEFHNGITGIVGPNGSGKSNVADAVRWVLGEQKIRQLRSSKMEDVIFAGTESRKPMGYAYVAITFDNSDHQLNVDYSEVTVSRRLFRSGESEYMINGTQVRLRDINEMFYDTGIGKEGYSIIGQGQIDKILSGKPEERRELFDEAAGIVKFKRRKNEAIKKLDDQNQNLLRVTDILGELERQVVPLEKQSEKAKRYLVLKDDLKMNDVNMYLIEVDEIKKRLAGIDEKISVASSDMQIANDEFKQIKSDYNKLEAMIEEIHATVEEKKEKLNETVLNIEKYEGQIRVIKEQINSAQSNESFMNQRISSLTEEISGHNQELDQSLQEKEENEASLKKLLSDQTQAQEELTQYEEDGLRLEEEIEAHKAEIIELLNVKAQIQTQIQKFDTLLEQVHIRKSQLNQKLIAFQSQKENQEQIIEDFSKQLESMEQEIGEVQATLSGYQEELSQLRENNKNLQLQLNKNQAAYHQSKSNLDTLKNITERYEGYGSSIKKVMELKASKKGIIGVVADIIKVDEKYEVAIETALGGNIQNIVTDTETTAKETIEYLKKNKFGRATFLPLSSMSNKTNFNAPDALEERGVIGLASDLVHISKKYEGVAKYLLGRVMVVDTIDHAISIERKYRYTLRIVTLEGEYLNVGGSISGGAFRNTSNLLGRRREIEELNNHLAELKKEKERLDQEILDNRGRSSVISEEIAKITEALQQQQLMKNTLEMNLRQANQEKDNLVSEYQSYTEENDSISEEIKNIEKNSSELNGELSGREDQGVILEQTVRDKTKALEALKEHQSEKRALLEEINIEIANIKQKHSFIMEKAQNCERLLQDLSNELKQMENNSQENHQEISARLEAIENYTKEVENSRELIASLKAEIQKAENEKETQNREHKEFFEKRESLSARITDLDKELYRLTSQKETLEEKAESKESYMWNEYEITYRSALEMKDEAYSDKGKIRDSIAQIRREMKSLGDVNINAIEEFKEVNERYQFMKTQHDDLMEAKENLLKIIDELEVGMRKQFREKLEEIKVEFDHVFKELFGGGKGTIELTDAEDILDAGIHIISQPPGKKLQNMMQLSGGEKALTAISLLFAIQNLKPSPFCLLDEIEAALDGSNVVRFAEYLHKLTKNTQFIVITHRRGTMNCADRLYGITMQEKGISALVSVDLLEKDLDK